jgi:hypothetical protein
VALGDDDAVRRIAVNGAEEVGLAEGPAFGVEDAAEQTVEPGEQAIALDWRIFR